MPELSHSNCAFTNIEALREAVISTAIHPCQFRQAKRFDVGPRLSGVSLAPCPLQLPAWRTLATFRFRPQWPHQASCRGLTCLTPRDGQETLIVGGPLIAGVEPENSPSRTGTAREHHHQHRNRSSPGRGSNPVFPAWQNDCTSDTSRSSFDVGPPFVGRDPATRSTEELLPRFVGRTTQQSAHQVPLRNAPILAAPSAVSSGVPAKYLTLHARCMALVRPGLRWNDEDMDTQGRPALLRVDLAGSVRARRHHVVRRGTSADSVSSDPRRVNRSRGEGA